MTLKNKSRAIGIVAALVLLLASGISGFAQSGMIDANTQYQTMIGFGAAVAFNGNLLTSHPNKSTVYNLIFQGLGLDILRIRNIYRNTTPFDTETEEIVKTAKSALGNSLTIFMASWTPPSNLKLNGTMNGGTLAKQNGAFMYSQFGDYWYNALVAYNNKGVVPDYISIQNEPDYSNTGWETCMLDPAEGTNAAYGKALDAVYTRLRSMATPPKILAPETTGIGSNLVQNYVNTINLSEVDGIAHHLYTGGDSSSTPDSFNSNFQALASAYPNKPKWQTEFDYGSALNTAVLIYNSLVLENVSAYIYWELIWNGGAQGQSHPLVTLDTSSYTVNDYYYSLEHYSKYVDKDYVRVSASSGSDNVKMTAFLSPDKSRLTAVIVNTATSQSTLSLSVNGFAISGSQVYRTAGSDKFASAGSLGSNNSVVLPAQSIVTVVMNGSGSATPAPTAVPVTHIGDVNSDNNVDIVDALLIAQFYVGLNPSNFNQANADTNHSGTIDIVDALLIAQCYVGLGSCSF